MIFHQLEIAGAYLLEPERQEDTRGFFTRGYCRWKLEKRGLDPTVVECQVVVNQEAGGVRGLAWQGDPHPQIRLVRATRGAVFAVVVDLRRDSASSGRQYGVELSESNRLALYVPAGCAHGYQTLVEEAEVFYQKSEFNYPESVREIPWDDPALGIAWPLEVPAVPDPETRKSR